MARLVVRPQELDLESPGRRDYWVALEHDSIWADHFIPLTVLVGLRAEPGRGLVAFGSNHGNEYEGPVALKNLLREVRTEDVLGRLIFVPVLNVAAFWAGTRDSSQDDGVNLNRAFVTGAGRVPAWRESRIASRPSCGNRSGRTCMSSSTCTPAARWPASLRARAFIRLTTPSRAASWKRRPAGSACRW